MQPQQQSKQEIQTSFCIHYTIRCLQSVNKFIKQNEEVPFDQFCEILNQFCFVFKQLNSFLGVAFSDVKEKVGHIKANSQKFPGHKGFISFIRMEIQKNIHILNGKDNAKKKVSQQFLKYSSTARNLLRMMWLLTFIRVTFTRCKQNPKESMSSILGVAYDQAFGNNHAWLIRKSAKLAMMASQNREKFIQVILKQPYNQQKFQQFNSKFLEFLNPVHDFLWKFYRENKIDRLQ